VSEDAIAAISPYLTEHINRFGDYTLNLARKPPNPTTATPSDGPPQPHETKWPILYRIVAILLIPVMWALDSGDVGRRRSEATLVVS
jgi:hypothetical protein